MILDLLAEITGRPRTRLRVPHAVALAYSCFDVALAALAPGHTPAATPEKVRLSGRCEFFDSTKAMRELGYRHAPAREALRKAVDWYCAHGYAS
jgi:dihydroflavonol-4-reductase